MGPAAKPSDDAAYEYQVRQFTGAGLRPYAPAHLSVTDQAGDLSIRWIRRSRIESDDWTAPEIPLGEESESYLLRVLRGEEVVREEITATPHWTYTTAAQAADGVMAGDRISVAQISASYGPGPASDVALPL